MVVEQETAQDVSRVLAWPCADGKEHTAHTNTAGLYSMLVCCGLTWRLAPVSQQSTQKR